MISPADRGRDEPAVFPLIQVLDRTVLADSDEARPGTDELADKRIAEIEIPVLHTDTQTREGSAMHCK